MSRSGPVPAAVGDGVAGVDVLGAGAVDGGATGGVTPGPRWAAVGGIWWARPPPEPCRDTRWPRIPASMLRVRRACAWSCGSPEAMRASKR